MCPIFVQDITVLPNLYSVPLNIQLQLTYGQLVVLWLNYFLGRLYNVWMHLKFSNIFCFYRYSLHISLIIMFQPLFPGESGVDQLVEIIKVIQVMLDAKVNICIWFV